MILKNKKSINLKTIKEVLGVLNLINTDLILVEN